MKEKQNGFEIPDGFIVFISGVPGVGKTTISYELLKKYEEFRIIQETDIMREVLLGYNDYLRKEFKEKINFLSDKVVISDHNKLLSLVEAKEQCFIMKRSIEEIIARQQRKGIASIINGVHIIPELLYDIADNSNIIFINLFINDENEIHKRILNRNPTSYMLNHIPFIFHTNVDLYNSTKTISNSTSNVFNIDVTNLDLSSTIKEIEKCFIKQINVNAELCK